MHEVRYDAELVCERVQVLCGSLCLMRRFLSHDDRAPLSHRLIRQQLGWPGYAILIEVDLIPVERH